MAPQRVTWKPGRCTRRPLTSGRVGTLERRLQGEVPDELLRNLVALTGDLSDAFLQPLGRGTVLDICRAG